MISTSWSASGVVDVPRRREFDMDMDAYRRATALREQLDKARDLSVRAGTPGEEAASKAAIARMLSRVRREVVFCRENRRLLGDRERRFLDQLRDNREPTAADAMRVMVIGDAIRNDPRASGAANA
jgi:hypothetical protein